MSGPEASATALNDDELAARAAWLYFAGGLKQSEIAKRFSLPTTTTHRMIARASRQGLVRVFVDVQVESCVQLENRIAQRFGLDLCMVAPDIGETAPLPLQTLGLCGANYLTRVLQEQKHALIGIGHGRTLASLVNMLPAIRAGDTRFVSLLGGLTRKYAANPYDVIHRLSDKCGAEAYMIPAPLFANSAQDKQVLVKQTGVGGIFEMIEQATLHLVGIGTIDRESGLGQAGMLERESDLETLLTLGARAEVLGQFIDAGGEIVSTPYDGRAMAPDLARLKGRDVVAVAGGVAKTGALEAALRSGLVTGLITDEASARSLIERTG